MLPITRASSGSDSACAFFAFVTSITLLAWDFCGEGLHFSHERSLNRFASAAMDVGFALGSIPTPAAAVGWRTRGGRGFGLCRFGVHRKWCRSSVEP